MHLSQLFPGVQQTALGYVEVPSSPGAVGALGDEAAVMMISGLGLAPIPTEEPPAWTKIQAPLGLGQRVTLLGVELPMWVWMALGLGLLGAGWFFFNRR